MDAQSPIAERSLTRRLAERRAAAETADAEPAVGLGARVHDVLDSAHVVLTAAFVVGIVLLSLVLARGVLAPVLVRGSADVAVVGAGDRVSGPHWAVRVDSVQRVPVLGPATARGVFLVVRITVQRRDGGAADLSPADFGLLGADGVEQAAEPLASPVYATQASNTQLAWASTYPSGVPVRDPLVFDVSPGARDLKLFVREASAAIRLPP